MRILLSSHGAGAYGAERMLLALARGLTARGHQVIVDFPHDGPALALARGIVGLDLRVGRRRRLPRNLAEGLLYAAGIPSGIGGILRLIRETRPDMVWANSLFNPWAVVAARLAGIPVVWHLHERSLPGPLSVLPSLFVAGATLRAVAVSEYVAGSYRPRRLVRRRLIVVHNPLLEEMTPHDPPPERPFTVAYVGQLEPRKRAQDLAAALADLPDATGVFVGDGKARGRLERAIDDHGVRPRTRLLGYRDDVPDQLGRAHALAIPSLREPFGLVALEAMAAGVPVVAARSGALPEVLGDAALYHEPRDPKDLARRLRQLRADSALRIELRDRGLRRVNEFDHSRWLDTMETLVRAAGANPEVT